MTLVAGIDTSTQACKVVVRDADTGALVRSGRAAHPPGTEVAPQAWEDAFREAAAAAGGLDDVAALAVGGQQHGMVCLDHDGEVVRDALLWNDVRSAGAAADLITELGDGDDAAGRQAWADAVGVVPPTGRRGPVSTASTCWNMRCAAVVRPCRGSPGRPSRSASWRGPPRCSVPAPVTTRRRLWAWQPVRATSSSRSGPRASSRP